MVELAPSFEEVAGSLAQRVSGNVLVAHNLSFDVRMLRNEYDRLDVPLDDGSGVCTLAATHEKLHLACARHGISISHQHRALADARATRTTSSLSRPRHSRHAATVRVNH